MAVTALGRAVALGDDFATGVAALARAVDGA
jgi:hypothetical protein